MKPTSPRVVLILSYLTYLLFGAFTAAVGPVLGELAAQTSSALATIGGVVTLLFVGAIVAQILAGPITDRFGHKAVLVASLLILGPAGLCAGMYAGRGMLDAVVLERGVPGGELLNTDLIEDYPGFASVKGHELARLMAEHAQKFGADIRQENVETVTRREDGSSRWPAAPAPRSRPRP